MISATRLTVSGLRARAVDVVVEPPLETASAELRSAPLVLVDLLTEEGVTGRSYAFCVTPLALVPMARLVSNLGPLIEGDAVAPSAIEEKLHGRFRLLGPQGLTGMAMAAVDVAAWDALAKANDLPLVELLADAEGMSASSHLYPEVSAHLLAVTPTRDRLEYLDLAGPVLKGPARVEKGHAVIPSVPGTGVEWDEERVERYLVDW